MTPTLLHHMVSNIRMTALYYAAIAGLFSVLWLWWRLRPGKRSALQPHAVKAVQIRREILTSVASVLVIGSFMPLMFALGLGHHTHFYRHIDERGWLYFFTSLVLLMLVQDTWFYWSHRAMHSRWLFRWVHRTHHRSVQTNPWTTYSISPLEALIDSVVGVLMLLLIPLNGWALFVFSIFNTAYAVYAHLGYELFPKGTSQHWLGRWINTATAHNAHHARGRYNYGWYFLFWDRIMGTLDPRDDHTKQMETA